nr:hypothetical protein [Tanacetum cinerariifolium]
MEDDDKWKNLSMTTVLLVNLIRLIGVRMKEEAFVFLDLLLYVWLQESMKRQKEVPSATTWLMEPPMKIPSTSSEDKKEKEDYKDGMEGISTSRCRGKFCNITYLMGCSPSMIRQLASSDLSGEVASVTFDWLLLLGLGSYLITLFGLLVITTRVFGYTAGSFWWSVNGRLGRGNEKPGRRLQVH